MLDANSEIQEGTFFAIGNRLSPFDLAAFNKHSNYFTESQKYKNKENFVIDLVKEFNEDLFFPYDSISDLIQYCNNNNVNFQISMEKVFPLYVLAKRFNVTGLIELIEGYISDNKEEFINLFPINTSYITNYFEYLISEHLIDYVGYDQLSSFPIHVLYRILSQYKQKNDILKNPEIIDFLFNVLNKQKKDAVVLFSIFESLIRSQSFLKRIVFCDSFDFNFFDKTLDIQNLLLRKVFELEEQKIQKEEEIKVLKEEVVQLKEEKALFVTKTEQENELQSLREEINTLKEERATFATKTDLESELQNMNNKIIALEQAKELFVSEVEQQRKEEEEMHKKKNEQLKKVIFESYRCIGENDNLETFNTLNGETQAYIFLGLTRVTESFSKLALFFHSSQVKEKESKMTQK